MKQNRILLLFAHPSQHRSEVNAPLFKLAHSLDFVTAVDLYAEYPNHNIDIKREQYRLDAHDVIIFQFPFYWYSTPSILKEWQDLVLEYGYAYGKNGTALKNKKFMCALSAGGNERAYHGQGGNHFTLSQFLLPLEQTAHITGMEYIAPFATFSSRSTDINSRIAKNCQQWRLLLNLLRDNKILPKHYKASITINDHLAILTADSKGQ